MASLLELLITDVAPRALASVLGAPAIVASQVPSLWVVPVTDELSMVTDCSDVLDGFELFTEGLAARILELSTTGRVLYVHVEFHGGQGFHAAAGWERGGPAFGPLFTATHESERLHDGYAVVSGPDMAVNVGLRFLGVHAAPGVDEFATLGLDRHRWNAEWAAHADGAAHGGT